MNQHQKNLQRWSRERVARVKGYPHIRRLRRQPKFFDVSLRGLGDLAAAKSLLLPIAAFFGVVVLMDRGRHRPAPRRRR